MKKVFKKLVFLLAIIVVAIGLTVPQDTWAKTTKKGTVKSVTVTNVKKKKLTLYTGKSFKLKTKVNVSGNASKAVTFATSNNKVATVSKKGVIKALKKGTAKITVTSKANKKKKVTITVTVKNPIKISSLSVKNGDTIEFKLTEAYKLTKDKVVIYTKQNYYGSYVYKPTVVSVVTKDNVTYTINLDAYIQLEKNEYVRVTAKGLPGTGDDTKETSFKYSGVTRYSYNYSYYEEELLLSYYTSVPIGRTTVKGAPAGTKVDIGEEYVRICNNDNNRNVKPGVYETTITTVKPNGDTDVLVHTFIVYNSNRLYTTTKYAHVQMYSDTYGSISNIPLTCYGGSSSYKYEIVESTVPQNLSVSLNSSNLLSINTTKAGTYKISVKITDANETNMSVIETVQVEFYNVYNITGTCNVASNIEYNSYARVYFIAYGNKYSDSQSYSANVYSDKTYSVNVMPGKYHMVFYDGISNYYSIGDTTINGNNTNYTINVAKK